MIVHLFSILLMSFCLAFTRKPDPEPIARVLVVGFDVDSDDFVNGTGEGTLISVNASGKKFWVGAAHVISGRFSEEIDPLILVGERRVYSFNGYKMLKKMLNNGAQVLLSELYGDPILGYMGGPYGSDFFYFEDQFLMPLEGSDFQLKERPAFNIRDLVAEPLVLGESVTIKGIQGRNLIEVRCKSLGFSASSLLRFARMEVLLSCKDTPVSRDGSGLLLAGVSGGPVIDGQGRVIATFTGGFMYSPDKIGHWLLRATPLFKDSQNDLYSHPWEELEGDSFRDVSISCFDFSQSGAEIFRDDLSYEKKMRTGECHFHYSKESLDIQYRPPEDDVDL